jgi:pimeloyl-ACP methyl ester carboxylesterase
MASLAVLLTACSSSSASPPATVPAPTGLPGFYAVPASPPSSVPGTLVKSERIAGPGIDGVVYRVLYVSEDVHNRPTLVTGLVMVPHTPPPKGGYPVVTWGHGTDGMADQCAPSLDPSTAVPLQNQLLARGWVVTASDYQGEGTPGLLPYLVGEVAARNTIDIVRAADHLAAAHAGKQYVVWGHSEGGQTAMFSLAIGNSYAPDLDLRGVVAGAPPSQFQDIYTFLKTSPFRYYLFMAGAGFNVAYGNAKAPLPQVLTRKGISLLPVLSQGCNDYIAKKTNGYALADIVKADPFTVPAWKKLLVANDPGSITTSSSAPLLIIQGGADEQIPVVTTQLLQQHECAIGQQNERWIYPGQSHAGVISVSMPDMVHWIADRFDGGAIPDPYQPTGLANIAVTGCTT